MIAYRPLSVLGNRYVIEDLLGEGGMGAVYRAKDRLTGHQVALKRLLEPHSSSLFISADDSMNAYVRLAQEFQILASLRHPNIIGVLDYGFDEGRQPYYSMELMVNAQDIRRAAQRKPLEVKVNYLIQTLQALAYLHRRGIIHRDLKPANILVKDDQVKVLDFGFATLANQAQIGATGTLAYLAPEIFNQQPASVASDLYAVGIIAYEMFIGRHPFRTDDVQTLIRDIATKTPDLSDIGSSSPLALVINRLLAKAPRDRYANSQQVMNALSTAIGQPPPTEDLAIRDSFLQAAPFIGRDAELAALTEALDGALNGSGSAWLVGGESGVGKSRLLAEIATLALIRGALVLRGTGIQEGSWPFQIWIEPLRRLILAATLSEAEASVLKELIPEMELLLEQPVPDSPSLGSPSAQQTRLRTTITALVRRHKQPIFIMLDDVQWMGDESLALLHQINAVVGDRQILIIADYRDDERPNLPETLPEMESVKLQRLTTQNISQLSQAMLGESGRQPQIVTYLERETEGNIFFLIEVVRALAEEAGQLAAIGSVDLPVQLVVGGIQRIIQRRISHVPADARSLLEVAAVLGREIDLDVLEAIDGAANLQYWLDECANAAIFDFLHECWQFAHNKLREGVLASLDTERRRDLHRQVAGAIETVYRNVPTQAAALAYHWNMAGDIAKESQYVRLAGEQARQISAGSEAVRFFKRSLELSSEPLDQAYLMTRIAEALFWLGEFGASRQYNLDALEIAREYHHQQLICRALTSLGNSAIHQGQYTQATAYHQEGLAVARTIQDQEMVSNALSGLGDISWRVGDYPQAMVYLRENLAVTQHLSSLNLKVNALNMLGIVYAMQNQVADSIDSFEQALAISRQTGDRSRIAQVLSNLGEVSLVEADYDSAAGYFEQALTLSQETGNRFSTGNVEVNLGLIALARGNPQDAREYFLQALNGAYQIDATVLMLGAVAGLARLDARNGEDEHSLELISLVLNHPAHSPDLQNILPQKFLDELEERLPVEAFSAALERGKTLDLKTTVESFLQIT